jgi:uncharacterized repeat protein (TIGR03837 family)
VHPAQIVIEGFGARPPAGFVAAMAARAAPPVWINLEYLSAEPWVETHHGLPSAQPTLPLIKYFFFPGFTAATGGLIVERGLVAARDAFQSDAAAAGAFRRRLGIGKLSQAKNSLWLSLFCYNNAALPALVEAWAASSMRVICVVPEGRALEQISTILGRRLTPGAVCEHDALTIASIAFLEQDDYDRLLWACDVNFVRGEDSLVRAQLAARPFVWQAYPQAEDAHLQKLRAFAALYGAGLDGETGATMESLLNVWNRQAGDVEACWAAFSGRIPKLREHAGDWAARLSQGKHLADALAQFCENKLK